MSDPMLEISVSEAVAHVTLNRPDVRNAFNAELIAELQRAFERLGNDGTLRAVILSGAGKTFCGGADINWMRASLELSREENVSDAKRMSEMFATIDRCPRPVIARIHGAALGGGAGLVAVCDVAIASNDAQFGFTEVKLGILPAVISPFVLRKIGVSHARALFLTGERFSAERAENIGLVHEVVRFEHLDTAVDRVVDEIKSGGRNAIAVAKKTIAEVTARPEDAREITSQAIAQQRTSPEGQEGLRAFLERRKPNWTE
ncbi:MAG: enoyl-CoA hydratase/isomerase family protein [Candidatus Eremiobacteraeota bacterium]|nr:enoyl-CoA hydratase/isomerase family protein [Candidatus Eremiobacteraeota bacterium]